MLVSNFVIFVILESAIKLPWLASACFAALAGLLLLFDQTQRRVIPAVLADPVNAVREDDPIVSS